MIKIAIVIGISMLFLMCTNPKNENLFLFYENWESRELWQTHMNNKHLADYMKATDGAVEEFVLNEMTEIK